MLRLLLTLITLAAMAAAQNVSSSLSGTVQDPAGAIIPSAAVTLTSDRTGFLHTTKTNAEGFFAFPYLVPGTYTLAVSREGFKTYTQSDIAVTSAEHRSLGTLGLQLGGVSESISVTAEPNPLNLASGERSSVLTGEEINGMALRGRDIADAIGLLPGVVDTVDGRETSGPSSFNNLFFNGGRSQSKNLVIDGMTSMDTGSNNDVHTTPSMDAVGEVKILMSNYSAEFGRSAGGAINIITRGGGKQFHGTAGWYNRNEKYNANNFFYNRNGLPRPRYRYNIGSYTVGGPVYIPGWFNRDRSKMFFFFSQEFQRQIAPSGQRTVTVPTELERVGDFSQSYDVNGRVRVIYDSLANQTPFPNNKIPAARFSSVGQNILKFFPLPNFVDPLASRRYQWNYISALSNRTPRRTEIGRLDFVPHRKVQTYLRVGNTAERQETAYGWPADPINFPLTPILLVRPGRSATLNSTITVSPTVFNELNLGVSHNQLAIGPLYPERLRMRDTRIDIPSSYPWANPGGYIPLMSFGGVANPANSNMMNPLINGNTIFSIVDNVSKVRGTHTIKAGVYIERTRKNQYGGGGRPTIAFGVDRNNPLDSNYAYANALLGVFASYTEPTGRKYWKIRFTNLEWYVSDAWRVSRKLSLDYGVRFYHDLPHYTLERGAMSAFVPALYSAAKAPVLLWPGFDSKNARVAVDPVTGKTYPQVAIGSFAPGIGDPTVGMVVGGVNGVPSSVYTNSPVGLAPRFGFAWDPFGRQRTALRGGGGVFYDRISNESFQAMLANPPQIFTPVTYYSTIQALQQAGGSGFLSPSTVTSVYGRQPRVATYNYSLGVQQQIGRGILLDVAYVGSLGRHMTWQRNINPVPPFARFLDLNPQNADPTNPRSALSANYLRPYQGYGDINLVEFASSSNYHALQSSLRAKLPRGLSLGASYTFSKALGTAPLYSSAVSPFFAPRERNYGPLSYDRTHVFSVHYNWRLPKPRGAFGKPPLGVLARDWELAGITRLISGAPFTPGFSTVDGQDITGTPSDTGRMDVIDPAAPAVQRFGRPARGSFGNLGLGVLRYPGVNNWDMSVYRRIRLGEARSIQVRFETYNTFNHTQFSAVSASARFDAQGKQTDPLFLQPTAAFTPRRIQLALSLNW